MNYKALYLKLVQLKEQDLNLCIVNVMIHSFALNTYFRNSTLTVFSIHLLGMDEHPKK